MGVVVLVTLMDEALWDAFRERGGGWEGERGGECVCVRALAFSLRGLRARARVIWTRKREEKVEEGGGLCLRVSNRPKREREERPGDVGPPPADDALPKGVGARRRRRSHKHIPN
jgi:hypothetical protein